MPIILCTSNMKSVEVLWKNRTRKKIFIINLAAGVAKGPKIEGMVGTKSNWLFLSDFLFLQNPGGQSAPQFRRPCCPDFILTILNGYDCPFLIWTWNGIKKILDPAMFSFKVNSVQEACAKCFGVHLLKFEILQTTWKNKNIKMLKNRKLRVWYSSFHFFFHVVYKS